MSTTQKSSKARPTRSARPQFGNLPVFNGKAKAAVVGEKSKPAPRSNTSPKVASATKIATPTGVPPTKITATKEVTPTTKVTRSPVIAGPAIETKKTEATTQEPLVETRSWSVMMAAPPTLTSSYQKAPLAQATKDVNNTTPTTTSDASSTSPSKAHTTHNKPKNVTAMTREQALALPETYYHDKAKRASDLINDVVYNFLPFATAATKNGFASGEEAAVALCVFGGQGRQMLDNREVYKKTMLLAMAKDKDGYNGDDMGKLMSEAWNERKEEDDAKAAKGQKKTEGQERARQNRKDRASERQMDLKQYRAHAGGKHEQKKAA